MIEIHRGMLYYGGQAIVDLARPFDGGTDFFQHKGERIRIGDTVKGSCLVGSSLYAVDKRHEEAIDVLRTLISDRNPLVEEVVVLMRRLMWAVSRGKFWDRAYFIQPVLSLFSFSSPRAGNCQNCNVYLDEISGSHYWPMKGLLEYYGRINAADLGNSALCATTQSDFKVEFKTQPDPIDTHIVLGYDNPLACDIVARYMKRHGVKHVSSLSIFGYHH